MCVCVLSCLHGKVNHLRCSEVFCQCMQGVRASMRVCSVDVGLLLWRIEDRTDKCGNKLEMVERRLESLMAEYKDFSRHLCQAFAKYRAEGENPEVLGSWVSYLKESWIEGRLRVMRDASEEACIEFYSSCLCVELCAWQGQSFEVQ